MMVLLSASTCVGQNGSSPLDGNWQIIGNREQKQYPLISIAIHVNGDQVTASGDYWIAYSPQKTCFPQGKGRGGTIALTGEVHADGTFILRNKPEPVFHGSTEHRVRQQIIVAGSVPPPGSTTLTGHYAVSDQLGPECTVEQAGNFTASILDPLTGTFSGPVLMLYPMGPLVPPGYRGPTHLELSINVVQGSVVSYERMRGSAAYIPLTGTIEVSGSPCFTYGTANASISNRLLGDLALIDFEMNDGSELSVRSYINPKAGAISIQLSRVKGGKCDKQTLAGMLSRQ